MTHDGRSRKCPQIFRVLYDVYTASIMPHGGLLGCFRFLSRTTYDVCHIARRQRPYDAHSVQRRLLLWFTRFPCSCLVQVTAAIMSPNGCSYGLLLIRFPSVYAAHALVGVARSPQTLSSAQLPRVFGDLVLEPAPNQTMTLHGNALPLMFSCSLRRTASIVQHEGCSYSLLLIDFRVHRLLLSV